MARIDHDWTGKNALAYQTRAGAGIEGASIRVFRRKDWIDGRRGVQNAVARVRTVAGGRWNLPIELQPGEYVLVYSLERKFGPDSVEITVT